MSENKQNSEITETAENNVLSSETAEPAQNDIVEGIVSNCKKANKNRKTFGFHTKGFLSL